MNHCESFRQDFDACRDQALQPVRQHEIEKHLGHCDQCRAEYERADRLETLIRHHGKTWQATPGLWQRIEAGVEGQANPTGMLRSARSWMAAALLMITVGITSFTLLQPTDEDSTGVVAAALVNEFHTFVVSHRELDFNGMHPAEIRNWFSDKVDFRVPLPVKIADLQLAGGRLCNMFDQRIASFMYQVDDAWVSLYIMRSPRVAQNSASSHERLLKGYGFIDWEHQGLHYSLVGDLPIDRLRQIAEHLRMTGILSRLPVLPPATIIGVSHGEFSTAGTA